VLDEAPSSVDTATENSARFGVGPEQEMLRLVVHGVLHVLGYTDEVEADAHKMERIQEDIVRRFSSILE
jgi:rRNA maturation RNase YbeY